MVNIGTMKISSSSSSSRCGNIKKWRRRPFWILSFWSLFLSSVLAEDTSSSSSDFQLRGIDSHFQYQQEIDSILQNNDVSPSEDEEEALFVGDEQEESSDPEIDRRLKSSSNDYWGRSAGYDDYLNNDDDDFYKYIDDETGPSLLPLTGRTALGLMLASIGIVLGSSGGIGGGGIVVPVYILAIGMSPRAAIPLGSITVMGGSLAGLLVNSRRRHPLADRPIIDWDLILVMEPLVLVGAIIGSMLHRIVSEKILVVLLVLLLSAVAHTTLTKAKRMYEAEARYIEHLKAAQWDQLSRVTSMGGWSAHAIIPGEASPTKVPTVEQIPSIPSPTRTMTFESVPTVPTKLDADEKQRILIVNPDFITLRSDILEQEKVTPTGKIIVMFVKFVIVMFLNITMGGGAFRSPWGILCGSVSYWVVHVIIIAFLIASGWAAQTYLINRYELKEIVRYDYVHGDIKWDLRNAIVYPFLFMCSGICAGMFGIGGGMICVPLMLAMGVHPGVVTATASAMMFFSTSLSTASFAVFNLVLWDFAIVCFIIGFFAALVGQAMVRRAKRGSQINGNNFERNSFVAYLIGGVIMLSALLMSLQYVLHIVSYGKASSKEGGLCEGYRV